MTVAGYSTAAGPIATFAHAVRGLHWSNARLTRAVQTFAAKLQKLSTLALPNVCGDVQSWAASGFTTVPASTAQFVPHYLAVTPEAEEVPLMIHLLMPYASPSDFPILRRVERLETRLGEAEAAAVETYSRVIMALELQAVARAAPAARRGRSCRCAPVRDSAARGRPPRRRRRPRSSPPGGSRSA